MAEIVDYGLAIPESDQEFMILPDKVKVRFESTGPLMKYLDEEMAAWRNVDYCIFAQYEELSLSWMNSKVTFVHHLGYFITVQPRCIDDPLGFDISLGSMHCLDLSVLYIHSGHRRIQQELHAVFRCIFCLSNDKHEL